MKIKLKYAEFFDIYIHRMRKLYGDIVYGHNPISDPYSYKSLVSSHCFEAMYDELSGLDLNFTKRYIDVEIFNSPL